MKRKCDQCNRPATHHSVEIDKGNKVEKHLCDLHAAQEGMNVKSVHAPINELLTNFVKLHSGEAAAVKAVSADAPCSACGMAFAEFKESSLLGCPVCYKSFDQQLGPLLERAHEGGTHHIGKVPRRAGVNEHRHVALQRLRGQLDEAVEAEDYELAARLRDDLKELDEDDD